MEGNNTTVAGVLQGTNNTNSAAAGGVNEFMLYVKYTFYAYSCMLVFGVPGNILVILTNTISVTHKAARNLICVALSVVDLCFLVIQYTRMAYLHFVWNDLKNVNVVTCKLSDYCYFLFSHLDAWMIVMMSVERLVAVYKPHLVKRIFSLRRAKWILAAMIFAFVAFDFDLTIR